MRIATLGGTGAVNNLAAVIVLMNRSVNEALDIDSGSRRELTTEELEHAESRLEDFADAVEARLREQL